MRITAALPALIFLSGASFGQQLKTKNPVVDRAFSLAVETLKNNTKDHLIKAGAEYGGEWVRDISINSWNAASLLDPGSAEFSLWSVTTDDRSLIGHQYWDKIIWVIGAYNHYLVTGDRDFLKQAYTCSANTMEELETSTFDAKTGLFMGPSVFNDGIAGYDEPVYDSSKDSGFVLDHLGSRTIKCLSTNCVYYEAYVRLAKMADLLGDTSKVGVYEKKAAALRTDIRRGLGEKNRAWLNYLIDQNGKVHPQQEGLGMSFAILFGVVTPEEARNIIEQVHVSPHGLPSIYPPFKRFSEERPGRHNNTIWPFVNAFWAEACLRSGRKDLFKKELTNLADLAIEKGKGDFFEIYNSRSGEPDGGWQGGHWAPIKNQTWSATGYLRMIFSGLLGMTFTPTGLALAPDFEDLRALGFSELSPVPYRSGFVDIRFTGDGPRLTAIRIDGKPAAKALVAAAKPGTTTVEYVFGK